MNKRTIIVASSNAGKVREITAFYHCLNLEFLPYTQLLSPTEPIPETGTTFHENARQKAQWVWNVLHTWVLADDSGLEVPVLRGAPGVHSARYAGVPNDDNRNLRKLLKELEGRSAEERKARFVCVMVLKEPSGKEHTVTGKCNGTISFDPAGVMGFGYDPVFIPDGYDGTFAQMDLNEKNRISHRARALLQLKGILHVLFGKNE